MTIHLFNKTALRVRAGLKIPKNWKSEIRPAILERAQNKCEFCGVENYLHIFRGKLHGGREIYQTNDGNIYDAANSAFIEQNYFAEISATGKERANFVIAKRTF